MEVNNKPRVKFEDTQNDDDSCGIFCFKPKWLQKYANPKIFLLDFSLIAIIRAAYFTYQISVMSTLEKRYAFPSKVSALILIADNLSGMIVSPIIGYIGTKIHGPRLIGGGMILVSLSCILSGMPYFVYGPGTHLLHQALPSRSLFNKSKIELCDSHLEECGNEEKPFEMGAYAFLCIASFINGLGYTAFWTIGIPYIDDNVKKKNSPLYLSKFFQTLVPLFSSFLKHYLSFRYYHSSSLGWSKSGFLFIFNMS
jgi:organic anion transporter polypeptide